MFLVGRHVFLGADRIYGTLGYADRTVNTFIGVDHQHIGTLPEAINRANIHAIGVAAADARFHDDMSHC